MKELIGLFCILSFTFRILASMFKALYYVARTLVLLPVAGYKCYKECKANKRESNLSNISSTSSRENNRQYGTIANRISDAFKDADKTNESKNGPILHKEQAICR
ncbi:hypothetical protein HQ884_07145 [Enterococcus faecium]|nr:hypothetical protein [Enterococcus faecium]EGP5365448.1 hypothetical protein [Enterococcus faecium]NTQ54228.1 hypothetical protein [Enterococcus faecium]